MHKFASAEIFRNRPIIATMPILRSTRARGGLLVACGDRSPLFQPCPETLDHVAVVVDPVRAGNGCLIALGGDRWACAALPDVLPEGMAGVASISNHLLRHARQAVEEGNSMREFMGLTGSHDEGNRSPEPIGDHAGLGAIAPTRSPKRLTCVSLSLRAPFRRAPAAFWCARMLVPSRNVIPSSTPRS